MLIFGLKALNLKVFSLPNAECMNCHMEGKLTISIFFKYFHVFWIPLLPIGKEGICQCNFCKESFEEREVSSSIRKVIESQKKITKSPIWQFSGIALVVIIMIWGSISSNKPEVFQNKFLKNPQTGDKYFISSPKGYTILKIAEIKLDSVWIRYNLYETNKLFELRKIDNIENYASKAKGMRIIDFQNQLDSISIKNIIRE